MERPLAGMQPMEWKESPRERPLGGMQPMEWEKPLVPTYTEPMNFQSKTRAPMNTTWKKSISLGGCLGGHKAKPTPDHEQNREFDSDFLRKIAPIVCTGFIYCTKPKHTQPSGK